MNLDRICEKREKEGKLLSVLNIFIERKLSINFDIYQGVDHFYLFAGILPDKVHLYQGVDFYKSFNSKIWILSFYQYHPFPFICQIQTLYFFCFSDDSISDAQIKS